MTREEWLQKWSGPGFTRKQLIIRWNTIGLIVSHMLRSRKPNQAGAPNHTADVDEEWGMEEMTVSKGEA